MPRPATNQPLMKRPGCWGIIAAGLVVAAAAVIGLLNTLVYTPQAAVAAYVAALQSGDGATAMALSQGYLPDDAPESTSTVLLDGKPLATASKTLADAVIVAVDTEIPEYARDEEHTQRVVEIRFRDAADEPRATSVVVDKVDTSWVFFSEWSLHPMPLQQVELQPSQMPQHATADAPVAQVNGASTPLLGTQEQPATLATFAPSLLTLDYDGTYLAAAEAEHFAVTDVLAPGAKSQFGIDIGLTQAVDDAITEKVREQLERCTQQQVLKPTGCPFGYQTSNRVRPETLTWSINAPEVEYSWENADPSIDTIIATATLSGQEIDIGTGQVSAIDYQEVFALEAQLELTPENILVRPDWQ